ncbi:hypothetical protein THAOC_33086 [Thalassiosira oceanica]|uniref:Uncharacterized protein n=1 Tax=Thalassiosira oceanica TaxID=159749 RepID=K0R7V8_THAOC|nr:hypothetical protein THAOC_33086 [Thalassiosira oceanica]|eukprot:EJK48144.1 hypothetical protein THAOC_33086 [Thalassiosira oceanica]
MKIWPVAFLAIAAVAATGSSSSEQTELLSIAFDKLQQTELIGRVGRAVHQARLRSSDDHTYQPSACTTAGGQIQAIPEISISCRSIVLGVSVEAKILNFPTCVGKDCPGDIMADDDLKDVFEAEMAKTLEGEFRNGGMPLRCSGSGSGGGSTPTSASSKVSALAAGALVLGALAL